MPNGFVGRPASAYLGQVSDASKTASNAASRSVEKANESLQSATNANAQANEAALASAEREATRLQNAGLQTMVTGTQMQSASIAVQRAAARITSIRPAPILREPRPVRLPHPPESAYIGRFSAWRGNSTNIVVNQSEYDSIYHIVDNIDNNMGACAHHVATEIEEMCRTSFILPGAGPRCLNISDSIKRSLGQFRMVTEDSLIQMRRYVNDMMGVG